MPLLFLLVGINHKVIGVSPAEQSDLEDGDRKSTRLNSSHS